MIDYDALIKLVESMTVPVALRLPNFDDVRADARARGLWVQELDEWLVVANYEANDPASWFTPGGEGRTYVRAPPGMTFTEARDFVAHHKWRGGCICPTCDQIAAVRPRSVSCMSALAMLATHALYDPETYPWVHVSKMNAWVRARLPETEKTQTDKESSNPTSDFAKLRFWDLLVERPPCDDDDDDKKRQGYWRLSAKGTAFVKGEIALRGRVYLFDNVLLGFDDKSFHIWDSLGNSHSYPELLKDTAKAHPGLIEA